MENLIFGFLTGGSLILVIGPQNIFVIEQGLKRNYIFTITTICAFSEVLLILLGIFVYQVFGFVSWKVEIFLNVILVLFLLRFIWSKFKELNKSYNIENIYQPQNLKTVILKTLGFTYLNLHVYSDTVFFREFVYFFERKNLFCSWCIFSFCIIFLLPGIFVRLICKIYFR